MKPPTNRAILKPAAAPQPDPAPALVIVRVVGQAISENGTTHYAGDQFETTPARATALGPLVVLHI